MISTVTTTIRISLINLRLAGTKLLNSGTPKYTPQGVVSIAQSLINHGYAVQLTDFWCSNYSSLVSGDKLEDDLVKLLFDQDSDYVAISIIYVDIPFLLPAIVRYKHQFPGKKIILGGPGVSTIGAKILNFFRCVDAVVEGEGDESIVLLLNALVCRNAKRIPGVSYWFNNNLIEGGGVLRIDNFNKICTDAYNLLPQNEYKVASISSSRGCRYSCVFCSVPVIWTKKVVMRDIDALINEICFLKKRFGINCFSISDDVFLLDSTRVVYFCNQLSERSLKINWDCFARVESFNPLLLALMVQSGLKNIYYGVESGSPDVLKTLGKKFTIKQATEVVLLSKRICSVTASFIWGFPQETLSDYKKTIKLAQSFLYHGVEVQQSAVSPIPGTPIFSKFKKELQFSPEMIPGAVGMSGDQLNDRICFIKKFPTLTSGFYQIKHKDLGAKWKIARKEQFCN